MHRTYWIDVRDKPAFFVAMMRELAGDNTQVAFEGNLKNCDFSALENLPVSGDLYFWSSKKGNSKSQTIVLPLTVENIKPITKQVLPDARIVHEIEHIQIQKENEIQLLVGDSFDNECISVGSMISLELLSTLKQNGIIKSYHLGSEIK